MKLVLAEKPSVAQSIAKVLGAAKREDGYLEGNGYVVSWCVGHLVELAQPEVYDAKYSKWAYADLPIFPMDWQYEVSAGTKKQFGILKKLMAREDVASLVCATDAGREGELIFRLVYHKAGCRKPFERLWISSMEDVAIKEGFENLRSGTEYDALYEAALCRERADWIVGINATRLFSTLYGQTLNVGRVMTPTLAMAVMREAAISAFKPELFYTVQIGLDKPYLRYVFDVADTGVRRSSPELKPWEVTPENRSYVMEAMERTFGVAADGVLEAQLEDIASALAAEYWDDYKKQFLDIVANSFLEEYDELNIEVAFKNAVANSVSYTMYCRFVESPDNYFEHEDFQKVFDFNTRQTVNALGTAVNAISTRMFQEIEKAIGEHEQIKATERSTDYERDDLQTGRRLSDSEPSVGERGRETSGQVRQDASSIFGTEQSDAPERHDSDGEPVPAPVGDRGNSESQSGVSDGAVPEGQPRTGQGNAADGVGAAHEQPESTGGGSRDDGAYQQLSLNLFLSENEQISFIDRAESFTPSAFSFAQEEIDHFLLLGSNTDEARKVVALEYMKQKPLEEIVQTLKQVYHGGYGLKEDSGNICAWYAEDGIHLAKGSSAIDSPRAQIVSWETVAERIGELLENGRFATNVELVEASGYERQKLAESLWHLYHDLSEEARSSNYLAILHQEPFRGFPDETADLAEKLDDPRFHATLVQQYSEFRKTLAENPDLLRFHYHKLNLIQKQLYELNMPLREYQTDMMQMPLVRQFITDDEVNADLTRGSGFSGGKARIYNYWQENHSAKEKMDFLKHEYGTGGHSHACSGATHSGQDHDA